MRKIDKVYKPEIERVIEWLDSGLVSIKRTILDEELAEVFGGICCYDVKDQDYMIAITENQPEYMRISAYFHELWHLVNNDFSKRDAVAIEIFAHRMEGRTFYGIFDNYEFALLQYLEVAPVRDMSKYKAKK